MKKLNNYRHGDVSLHGVTELPQNLKAVEHNGEFPIAFGEVTGHRHIVKVADPKTLHIFQDEQGRYVLEVKDSAEVSHEEHKTITIERGIYIQEAEQERDPFMDAITRVRD